MKQAVILAGGKGTRLMSVLGNVPKPLAEVGGEPLLGHQLRLLARHGFEEVILLVSHEAEQIRAWLDSSAPANIRTKLVDDGQPRGTAGAVLAVLDLLAPSFAVLYADTMLEVDLSRFYNWHAAIAGTAASLFLHPNDHPQDSDLVEQDSDGRIVGFHSYPHPEGAWLPNLVNAALYILNRDALLPYRDTSPPFDFGKDLFPRMLADGLLLRGYVSSEYIKDAGTPSRLEKVRKAYDSGAVQRASFTCLQRAVFIDRDGVLNKNTGHVVRPEDLQVFPFVGAALRRLNEAEWRAIVVTNQPVLARGDVTEAELRRIHARLDTEVAKDKSFFDRLYLCPHHPDSGFLGEVPSLKRVCDCRKPAPGMIVAASNEFNISLADSWMIGDSTADLGAAEEVGVSSILVETGAAGLDDRYPYEPGFTLRDMAQAVDFILDTYPRLAKAATPLLAQIDSGQDWFVGGTARSGKSTLAATLARELRRRGQSVVVIQLDRWTLPLDQSQKGVLNRYDMSAIEATFYAAASRSAGAVTLHLPVYSRLRRQRLPLTRLMNLPNDAVVIWEGGVALELARRVGLQSCTVKLETDSNGRRARFTDYGLRLGVDAAVIAQMWESHLLDGDLIIAAFGDGAHQIINLDEAFAGAFAVRHLEAEQT